MKIKTKAIALKGDHKIAFWMIVSAVAFVFSMYVFFVNKAVMNVVHTQKLQSEFASLNSSIGEKEFEYISLKNKIDLEYAYKEGFKEVSGAKYISSKTLGRSVSLSNEI